MLAALLLALALVQDAPKTPPDAPPKFAVDAETVERVSKVAIAWVDEASGAKFGDTVRAKIATTSELRDILAAENVPLFEVQLGAGDASIQGAANFANAVAPALLAKYVFGGSEVLVSNEGFLRMAEVLGIPELLGEEALRAVLVHEFVHAADERLYHWNQVLRSLRKAEQIEAFNAVIEGHAQLLTRRICTAHDSLAGFDTFNRAISGDRRKTAADGAVASNPLVEVMEKLMKLRFTSWYVQGEKFVLALETEGGADLVRRAFEQPPARMSVVYQPTWYLHPELEPKGGVDLQAVLDELAATWPREEWRSLQNSITPAQLEVALSLAEPEARKRTIAALRANRSLTIVPADGSGARMVVALLLEFSSPEECASYLETARDVSRKKDEAAKQGVLRVTSSEREELPPGARRGFCEHKKLKVGADEIPVDGAVMSQECVALEMVFSNRPTPTAEILRIADQIFRSAALHPAK